MCSLILSDGKIQPRSRTLAINTGRETVPPLLQHRQRCKDKLLFPDGILTGCGGGPLTSSACHHPRPRRLASSCSLSNEPQPIGSEERHAFGKGKGGGAALEELHNPRQAVPDRMQLADFTQ